MHKINIQSQKKKKEDKIYFVIMSNVFQTKLEINYRYDLKGSLYKRTTPEDCDFSVARKDLDFLKENKKLIVASEKKKYFLE